MSKPIDGAAEAAGSAQTPQRKVGWLEGRRRRKEAQHVAELVNSATLFDNGTSRAKVQEAIELFKNLEPEYKEAAILSIEPALAYLSSYTFENDIKPRQVHIIADFMATIAPYLPKDASGEPITEPYEGAMHSLARVTENYDPEGGHKAYPHVVQACVAALWEFGYPSYQFWATRAHDSVTQEMTIARLLDMPLKEGQDPQTHGWQLLKENVRAIGPAIIKSFSDKKIAFLENAIATGKPAEVVAAMDCLSVVYCDAMPKHLDMSNQGIKDFWQAKVRGENEEGPLTQQKALSILLETKAEDGKRLGWSFLREQLRHIIIPMALNTSEAKYQFLARAARNENPAIMEAAFKVAASSESIPAEMIKTAKERKASAEDELGAAAAAREGLLGKLRSALAARHNDATKRQEAREAIPAIRKTDEDATPHTEALSAASEFLDMVNLRKRISKGSTEGLESLDRMLTIYAADHGQRFSYLSPFIRRTYDAAMQDILGGDETKQLHALNALSIFDGRHVTAGPVRNAVNHALAQRIDKGPEAWNGILVSYLGAITDPIVTGDSSRKMEFLMAMAGREDAKTVQAAFNAVLWVEGVPDGFKALAQSIKADEGKNVLHPITEDFLDTMRLVELVGMGNGDQFTAATALVDKYRSGKRALGAILYRTGAEMVDVVAEPGGSTEEEKKAQRGAALDIVVAIAKSGIRLNDQGSVLLNAGIEAVKTLQAPPGATEEEKQVQREKASDIIGGLVAGGISIPGVRVELHKQG